MAQNSQRPALMPGTPLLEVKLFAGRVPRAHNEDALRPIFEQFGEVADMTIIRDRDSGAHKGCAFVRMKSLAAGDAAIRVLNNQKVLEAVGENLGPMTVKYAQGEAERLGLPSESGGGIDQAKLFVGSLAKTTTEDEVRAVFGRYGTLDEVFIMRDDQGASKSCCFIKFAFKEEAFNAVQNLNQKHTFPGAQRPLEVRFATNKKAPPAAPAAPGGKPAPPAAPKPWTEYFTPEGRPYYYNAMTGVTQWDKPADFDKPPSRPGQTQVGGPYEQGPPGANVFVFHCPPEWRDAELRQHFAHFGNIISVRVTVDRDTGRSKGYGFVSYDNVGSAVNAVNGMNGFSVGGKRLKVHIKKGEETNVPQLVNGQATAGAGPQMGMNGMQQPGFGAFAAPQQGGYPHSGGWGR